MNSGSAGAPGLDQASQAQPHAIVIVLGWVLAVVIVGFSEWGDLQEGLPARLPGAVLEAPDRPDASLSQARKSEGRDTLRWCVAMGSPGPMGLSGPTGLSPQPLGSAECIGSPEPMGLLVVVGWASHMGCRGSPAPLGPVPRMRPPKLLGSQELMHAAVDHGVAVARAFAGAYGVLPEVKRSPHPIADT